MRPRHPLQPDVPLSGSSRRHLNVAADIAGVTFAVRAAAIVRRSADVLIGRAPGLDFWYLPGGRVLIGETAHTAVVREVEEELGSRPTKCRLIWVTEGFFADGDTRSHEIGFFFDVRLPDDAAALAWSGPETRTDTADGVTEEWRWVAIADLSALDLRPPFLKERLARIPERIEHLLDDRRSGQAAP